MADKSPDDCVLVVEDPLIRRFVRSLLEREGRVAVEAETDQALRTLRTNQGTVCLLITNSPGEFLEFAETLPVIYVATFPDPALAGRFRNCRTLRKPFRPRDLLTCAAELAPPHCA